MRFRYTLTEEDAVIKSIVVGKFLLRAERKWPTDKDRSMLYREWVRADCRDADHCYARDLIDQSYPRRLIRRCPPAEKSRCIERMVSHRVRA